MPPNYEIKELEWTGTGWYKKIIFDAQNECGNISPTKVERTYFLPSANGTGDITQIPVFKIYPNPANESIWIQWDGFPLGTTSQLQLFDLTGRSILKIELSQSISIINTSNYPVGLYLIKVSQGLKTVLQQKIIIQ